ncbi:hypothetical protein ECIV_ORF105 [European chub iridovirus]|nr:hypothetical protein ECIV_ORF105 [European chub iridovirus]
MVFLHNICASGSLEALREVTHDDTKDYVFDPLFEPHTLDTPLHKCAENLEMAAYLIDTLRHPLHVVNAARLSPAFVAVMRVGLKSVGQFYRDRGASFNNVDAVFKYKTFDQKDVDELLSNKQAYVTNLEAVVRATFMFPKNLFFLNTYKDRIRLDPSTVTHLLNETMASTAQVKRLVDKWCVPERVLDVFMGDAQLDYLLDHVELSDVSYRAFVHDTPLPAFLAQHILSTRNKVAARLLVRLCRDNAQALHHEPLGYRSAQKILKSQINDPLIQNLLAELERENGY